MTVSTPTKTKTKTPATEWVVRAVLLLVGLLTVTPGAIALLPDRIDAAYGVTGLSADTVLILRHRAVLLALLGTGLVLAAWLPRLRAAAIGAAVISKASFVALALGLGANPELNRVAWTDIGALAALGLVIALLLAAPATRRQ